jgi:hypothetical protein
LDDFDQPEDHTLIGLVTTPLKQIHRTPTEPSWADENARKS